MNYKGDFICTHLSSYFYLITILFVNTATRVNKINLHFNKMASTMHLEVIQLKSITILFLPAVYWKLLQIISQMFLFRYSSVNRNYIHIIKKLLFFQRQYFQISNKLYYKLMKADVAMLKLVCSSTIPWVKALERSWRLLNLRTSLKS